MEMVAPEDLGGVGVGVWKGGGVGVGVGVWEGGGVRVKVGWALVRVGRWGRKTIGVGSRCP